MLNALTSILVRRGFGPRSAAHDTGPSSKLLFYTSLGIPTSLEVPSGARGAHDDPTARGSRFSNLETASPFGWKSDGSPAKLAAVAEDPLTPDQLTWFERDEKLWRKAAGIVAGRPDLDLEGVYHVLRNLERSPAERLRRALSFAGFRSQRA